MVNEKIVFGLMMLLFFGEYEIFWGKIIVFFYNVIKVLLIDRNKW